MYGPRQGRTLAGRRPGIETGRPTSPRVFGREERKARNGIFAFGAPNRNRPPPKMTPQPEETQHADAELDR